MWPSTSEQSSTCHEYSLRAFVLSFLSSLSLCSLPTTILNGGLALKSHAPRPHNRNCPVSAVPLRHSPGPGPAPLSAGACGGHWQAQWQLHVLWHCALARHVYARTTAGDFPTTTPQGRVEGPTAEIAQPKQCISAHSPRGPGPGWTTDIGLWTHANDLANKRTPPVL